MRRFRQLKEICQQQRTASRKLSPWTREDLATLTNLAIVNYRMGNYRASEDLLLACIGRDKRDQEIHFLLGEAYYAQEKVAQAINQWTEALQLGPNPRISARLEKARKESGVHSELGVLQSAHFILRYDRKVSDYQLGQQILTTLGRPLPPAQR